jgi:hypothetical protein
MVPLERSRAINMTEHARVMKPGSWLTASVAFHESYIFDDATKCEDRPLRIDADSMEIVKGIDNTRSAIMKHYITVCRCGFVFFVGFANNDYYAIISNVFG